MHIKDKHGIALNFQSWQKHNNSATPSCTKLDWYPLQEAYIRGVSGWNFDVAALKRSADQEGSLERLSTIHETPSKIVSLTFMLMPAPSAYSLTKGIAQGTVTMSCAVGDQTSQCPCRLSAHKVRRVLTECSQGQAVCQPTMLQS